MLRGFHKLCDKGLWEEARNLLHDKSENANTARETASQPGGYGEWTALHIACKRDPPADVIKTLCELSVTPAETFDLYNKLPIHYAAEYGADVGVMKALIECCPQCLSGVDNEGRTALHLSFKYSIRDPATLVDPMRGFPSLKEVEVLLGDDESIVWATDENDYIAAHYAASNIDNCELRVLEKLVNTDINTVIAQTKSGMTPLHLALLKTTEKSITVEITQLLLGISPDGKEWIEKEFEGTRMLSCTDMLPLHYACQNFEHVPVKTLQLLLERCPTAAAAEALEGGYPLQILESQRVNIKHTDDMNTFNEKSDMLFAYHPNILPYRNDKKRLERFEEKFISELSVKNSLLSEEAKSIWTWMCMFPEEADEEGLYANIIGGILAKIKDAGSAKMSACIMISRENGEDTPLYQATSPTITKVLMPYLRFVDRYEIKKGKVMESQSTMVVKAYDSTHTEDDERSNVVITFYSNREEFWQEVDVHTKLQKTADSEGLSSPVIKIIQTFDMDRMGTSLETGDDMKFSRDITDFSDMYANISGYSYGIVREESGEIVDSISNYNCVDKKFGIQNKKHVKDIAESILCLHKNNYVLGEMKIGDFVQLNGKTIKLRNVKSIVEFDPKSKSHTKFYGSVSDDFGISNLPPEMITKLDAEGVEKYTLYWSRVSNDFNIANELTPEQVKESDNLKTYLEEEGCSFEDFWTRVQNNAVLWKRIQPRQVGGYYYVVKCFRAGVDGGVHNAEELPYDLVPTSTNLDIWFFGSLMFELITGESLLHSNKSKNIVNDSDFERLFNWSMTDHTASRRLSDINNPLGRDLLRSLLTSPNTQRQRNMETILKHPFFFEDEDNTVPKMCSEIIQEEKEEARKYKIEQDLKLRKYNLDKRTEHLSLISPETQLRFELSQWKLLMLTYDLNEVTFPTSCIVLPYELEKTFSGDLRVPAKYTALGHRLGLIIADILHYLKIVTDIKPRWTGQSCNHKTQEYMDKNRVSTSVPEDTLVRICEGVINKAQNATVIVADVITSFLSSGDGASVARKLISDTLRDIVDLDICDRVVAGAEAAQQSISSLLETLGDYPGKSAENMMNEQMRDIIGVNFTEQSFAKKEIVQNVLLSIVQQTAENPLSVMEELLESRMCELIDLYTEMDECHVYFVDEYSGLPVAPGGNSLQLNFSSDIAKTLIPPTLLAMRFNFPLCIVPLLGLTLEGLPEQWTKLTDFDFSSIESNPVDEIRILQATLGIDKDVSMLSLLERFFTKHDPEEEFSGLRRLCSPNGLMIWVTKKSRETALQQAKQCLAELMARTAIEAKEKVMNATKNKSKNYIVSLWCDGNVPFPQTSQTDLSSPSSGRGSPVSHQRRWRNSKDFDKDQYDVQRNDIQKKLDKLKGLKTAQRTESSRSDGFTETVTQPQRAESSRSDGFTESVSFSDDINCTYSIEDPNVHDATHISNPNPNASTTMYQHEEKEQVNIANQTQFNNAHIRSTFTFESNKGPEPQMETTDAQRRIIDRQLSEQTSEATTVDENRDTCNMVPNDADKMNIKHYSEGNAGSGNIHIGSLDSVKSDISLHSDDDEDSEWPTAHSEEIDLVTEIPLDRNTSLQQHITTTPRTLQHGRKSNLRPHIFHSDDTSSMASSKLNTDRLRPKSVFSSLGPKRGPTPGGRSMLGDRGHRILGTNSKAPQRMHSKKPTPFQGSESDDNDSYFRAPRSRFNRICPEGNE